MNGQKVGKKDVKYMTRSVKISLL